MVVKQHICFKWLGLVVISIFFVTISVSQDLFGAVKDGRTSRADKLKVIQSNAPNAYRHYCANCHGDGGKGDGKAFPIELKPKPRDFTDAEYMSKLKDDDIKKVIVGGTAAVNKSNLCPAWGKTFDDKLIKELVAYVRTFSGAPPSEVKKPVEAATNSPKEAEGKRKGRNPFIVWPILVLISGFLIWRALSVREHISFLKGRS